MITTMLMTASVAAGCRPEPPPSQTPQPPATAPPPSETVSSQEALDTYRRMWDTVVTAAATADPDTPQLRRYAADAALAQLVTALYIHREQGEVILGTITLAPAVDGTEPGGRDVRIKDCVDTGMWLVYRSSGGLVDDVPGGRRATTATVTRRSDGWRVSTLDVEGVNTC